METNYSRIAILDYGYIQPIEVWGSDRSIVENARMSTDKGFLGWGTGQHSYVTSSDPNMPEEYQADVGDEKLLKYLWRHKHLTPFECCGMTFEVKAPIFVIREWFRHRTQSYVEQSARYTPLPNENYLPTPERIMEGVLKAARSKNKQAAPLEGTLQHTTSDYNTWLDLVTALYQRVQDVYTAGLEIGVPKELARIVVPVARYSRMRASANLRNWLQFLELRDSDAAQKEIVLYAQAIRKVFEQYFPHTAKVIKEIANE